MRPPTGFSLPRVDIQMHPWFLFLIFLFFNSLLSYFSLTSSQVFWTSLTEAFFFLLALPGPRPVPAQDKALPKPAPWAFILAGGLFLVTRFWEPTVTWLLADEGRYAFFSREVAQHGFGRMLWGETQAPPLAFWLFGFFFKFVPITLFTLRLIPALLALPVLWVGHRFASRFFDSSLSFVFCWLLVFSFWPLSFGRLFECWELYLLLEIALLYLTFRFSKALEREGFPWGSFLGLTLVLSSLYYLALIGKTAVGLMVLAFLFWNGSNLKKFKALFFLLCAVGSLVLPMVLVEIGPGGMNYLSSQRAHGFNPDYLTTLFWIGGQSAPYGPAWGGCFDPILTSFAMLGLIWLYRQREWRLGFWLLFSIFLSLMPGFLSIGEEMFRVLTVLPFALLLIVFGLRHLLLATNERTRSMALVLLLAFSSLLNIYHYWGPFNKLPPSQRIWRNDDFAAIFHYLEEEKAKGKAPEFLDFIVNDFDDKSLRVLSDPLLKSVSTPGKGEWVILTDPNYEPFLRRRFPQGDWRWVHTLPPGISNGVLLGTVPFSQAVQGEMEHWSSAAHVLEEAQTMHFFWQRHQPIDPLQDYWFDHYPDFQGDPFLESVFGEEGALIFNFKREGPLALACYRTALKRGYPAAHLFNEMGSLFAFRGQFPKAKEAFQNAMKAPVDRTRASENLQNIELELMKR